MSLAGKKIFVTGGSRGIGLAIAIRAAKDGAMIAIAAKTNEPNPKLAGTIHTAASEITAAGGKALAIQCDLRDENQISAAVDQAAKEFGGIDILINNASAINLTPTLQTPAKRFDLMFDVNVRGTFLTSQAVLPHLQESAKAGRNPHILTLSPPLSMKAKWFPVIFCGVLLSEKVRDEAFGAQKNAGPDDAVVLTRPSGRRGIWETTSVSNLRQRAKPAKLGVWT